MLDPIELQDLLLLGSAASLSIAIFLCLFRAVLGPRMADRLVAANAMGTMIVVLLAIMALHTGEGYLADICLIYAALSFLATVVLTRSIVGGRGEAAKEERA